MILGQVREVDFFFSLFDSWVVKVYILLKKKTIYISNLKLVHSVLLGFHVALEARHDPH